MDPHRSLFRQRQGGSPHPKGPERCSWRHSQVNFPSSLRSSPDCAACSTRLCSSVIPAWIGPGNCALPKWVVEGERRICCRRGCAAHWATSFCPGLRSPPPRREVQRPRSVARWSIRPAQFFRRNSDGKAPGQRRHDDGGQQQRGAFEFHPSSARVCAAGISQTAAT